MSADAYIYAPQVGVPGMTTAYYRLQEDAVNGTADPDSELFEEQSNADTQVIGYKTACRSPALCSTCTAPTDAMDFNADVLPHNLSVDESECSDVDTVDEGSVYFTAKGTDESAGSEVTMPLRDELMCVGCEEPVEIPCWVCVACTDGTSA